MAETFKEMKCPACQKDMKKIFVPRTGINVDICIDGCGGMFFDNRELAYFDEQDESIDEILTAISNKTFAPVDESNVRTCPACGAKMVKNFTSVKREIQMDECYSCGGKFLDAGELQSMRAEFATEEDRSAATLALVEATVGSKIRAMELAHEEALKNRSPFLKLMDSFIFGNSRT